MVLRLTAACNNRCFFCMVDDEIAMRRFRPFAELAAELDATPADEEVDIFGGEPTIDPAFWEVLEHALSTGRTVTLASNVRLFSHAPSAERLARLGDGRVEVRTSLMGHDAELHDRLNGVRRGAFDQTTQGIRNLTALGVPVQVNVVVLQENLEHLMATALVAVGCGAPKLKFSGLIRTGAFLDSVPHPALVREQLATVIPVVEALGVRVGLEKLSPCVAPGFLHLVRRESDPEAEFAGWFSKVPACSRCALVTTCPGAEKGAVERHGDAWVQPIDALPDELVREVPVQRLAAYAPAPSTFVRVVFDDDDPIGSLQSVAEFAARNPHVHLIA